MKFRSRILAVAACTLALGVPLAEDRPPTERVGEAVVHFINLGTAGNHLTVSPPELTLKRNVIYRFVVSNPSKEVHVVAAPEFVASTRTTKLTRVSSRKELDYPVARLTTGIQVQPGEMLEWTFTPIKDGTYKFGCNERLHAAAGMQSIVRVRTEL